MLRAEGTLHGHVDIDGVVHVPRRLRFAAFAKSPAVFSFSKFDAGPLPHYLDGLRPQAVQVGDRHR
jgi:hypothetical protein